MDHNLEKILNRYLKEIDVRLEEINYAARKEFLAEIRSHLVDKWESGEVQNEESLLQVINEFGDPAEIAEDYLAKSTGEVKPQGPYPPSWLVLVLTVFLWPAGIILAWISPAWRLRDKIIATLIPVVAVVLVLVSLLAARIFYGIYQFQPGYPEDIQVEVIQ